MPSDPEAPAILAVPGAGMLVRRDATAGARALVAGLAEVSARLRPSDPIRFLTAADEDALLDWEAEAFRRKLDRRATTP